MDYNQLKTFVAVVEAGSFSRAGDKLFLSQPTVTTQIKLLEQELSRQLLMRSTNGIQVTEDGQRIFEYAKRALQERENILSEFGKSTTGIQTINLAASSIPGQYVLPEIIGAFRKKNPQVRVQLKICNSAKVCQALLARYADLGMCGSNSFQGEFDYVPVVDDPLVVVTPDVPPFDTLPEHAAFPEGLLKEIPFVIREEGSGSRREFEKWLHCHTSRCEVNIAAVINDNQAIKNTVAAGTGISVMSARAVQNFVQQGLLRAFPLAGTADRKLYLVKRKKHKLMGEIANFYQFIQEYAEKNKLNP